MKITMAFGFACVLAVSALAEQAVAREEDQPGGGIKSAGCSAISALRLPDVRIAEAVAVEAGTPPGGAFKKAHCKVAGVIGKEIRFEVLLPDDWNQRFFMGGGGGFVGSVVNQAAGSVNAGFATAGTDTGHEGSGLQAGWALNDLERQLNFGHLAVHRTATVAKAIVRAYYDADATRAYFFGCSRGGGQALIEAQRYPDDFDGIVSAAPALDWPAIAAAFVKNSQAAFPDPATLSRSVISRDNLKLLESSILAACDVRDGVKDGVMEDPRNCAFKVGDIPACADDRPGPQCLTKAQRAAIERIYAPTVNQEGAIYDAQPFGGEGEVEGWENWITGVNQGMLTGAGIPSLQWAFGSEFFKYFVFHDASWDYSRYDLANWKRDTRLVATFMNATNPDLAAFKSGGRKLLLWHGWSDPALSALATIAYYQQVEARDPAVRDYFRMFLLPGVLHCGGGPGPDTVDWFTTVADWVERGKAPDRLIATKLDKDGKVARARALCPYPQRSVYLGKGSTDVAESYACKAP
jgi:feruloyl esterase